ncbi:MAG: hypothetical protein IJ465_08355 [Clostridia bacterium]|nr:hypothetical protein [Clostridia bacterium]
MKKTLALLLALLLLLTAVACDKGDSEATNITTTSTTKQETSGTESSTTSTTASSSTSVTTTELTEPKDYAVAMEISINPKFKLYLDKNFKTLYIKGLNDDAREVLKNFRFYGDETFETIVDSLIAKSKEAGYVKGNDVVNIQIFYMNKKSVNVEEMNNRMEALRKSMSQKYSAIIKFKVPSDMSTTTKTSTTKTTITTTTTTTKKPTTTTSTTAAPKAYSKISSYKWVYINASASHYYEYSYSFNDEINNPFCGSYMWAGGNATSLTDIDPYYIRTYNGVTYEMLKGSGGPLNTVTINDNTITITDENNSTTVLERISETAMKVISTDNPNISANDVFNAIEI